MSDAEDGSEDPETSNRAERDRSLDMSDAEDGSEDGDDLRPRSSSFIRRGAGSGAVDITGRGGRSCSQPIRSSCAAEMKTNASCRKLHIPCKKLIK
ncbi:hypothetical protein QE152_g27409 [Popillia japonica]|uniref:Uncharacterized protein n=1 Tax=Popillia japonica TaxID=7064 RepID=A0AAW1JV13_POPJA